MHIATAPKSNASYQALDAAIADVRAGKGSGSPSHLRDAHYAGAKKLGHGTEYLYAHDAPHGVVAQQYAPDDLVGRGLLPPQGAWERGTQTGRQTRGAAADPALHGPTRKPQA